jgi:hypothetical protein
MITDRTIADIDAAKKIISQKLKNFEELTDEDRASLERGMLTINTLNRIENAERGLADILKEMWYFGADIESKEWKEGDFFYLDDLQRLINNAQILRGAFYALKNSPVNIVAKYHYLEFNALERLISDIYQAISVAQSNFKECNTFYCGEE